MAASRRVLLLSIRTPLCAERYDASTDRGIRRERARRFRHRRRVLLRLFGVQSGRRYFNGPFWRETSHPDLDKYITPMIRTTAMNQYLAGGGADDSGQPR